MKSLFSALLLASLAALHAAAAPEQKPDLLWITAEDICPNLGCYGDPDAVTPNLANRCDPAEVPRLRELLQAGDGAVRRWGAIGLLALRENAAPAVESLLAALEDSSPDVRMTSAEALCGLGRSDIALPVLIELLSFDSRIIRNETFLALSRIGPDAKPALPHLNNARPPCRHTGIWSHDNIPLAIEAARSCIDETASTEGKLTRRGYLP